MVEPISPEDVYDPKPCIPDFVITAFNTLIQKNWDGNVAIIRQNEAVDEIKKLMPDSCKESDIYDNHWLDVEDLFLVAGWDVIFHKRDFYEPMGVNYYKFCKPVPNVNIRPTM